MYLINIQYDMINIFCMRGLRCNPESVNVILGIALYNVHNAFLRVTISNVIVLSSQYLYTTLNISMSYPFEVLRHKTSYCNLCIHNLFLMVSNKS